MAERRAIDAEREVEDLKMADYMVDKVGQTFEGMIVSITNFGMFVQVEDAVEGLVHMSSMKNDYYEYNERGMMLIGRRTGEIFRIGEKVKVKLINVDIEQYDIDFELAQDASGKKKSQKQQKQPKKGQKKQRNNSNRKRNNSKNNNKNKGSNKNKNSNKKSKNKQASKNKKADFKIRKRGQSKKK